MEKFDFVRSIELGLGFGLGLLIAMFIVNLLMPIPLVVKSA
jgi:hypothetical protein